ncbi:MAG TPA: AMP-binding protein [Desulfomonilaceae bacterium]|nr:AMP-binding protein [Desulfomonilaceae bacterium]
MVVGDELRRSFENHPDKLAVKDMYGKHFPEGMSFTYRELVEAVNRLANSFMAMGLSKGDRVAVQTGTGVGHILTLFAAAKAGMALTPIDRSNMADEITYIIQDSGARAFVVDADIFSAKVAPIKQRLSSVQCYVGIGEDHPCEFDFGTLVKEGSSHEPGVVVNEDDIVTLIYTSGTTGKPKGVPLTHRNWTFSAYMWAAELGVHPYTKWLLVMPLHTSGGTGLSLASAIRGCSLIVTNPDPKKILHLIEKERITFTQFSPTLLANVIRHPNAKHCDFSSMESWFTSAAPISAELLKEGAQYFGKKFTQLFGTTETALLGTVLRPEDVSVRGLLSKRLTSIGKACLGYKTKVVDSDGMEIKPGGSGELLIKGGGVAQGYWKRPEAEDFKNGWWHSGDVVRVDEEGFYYVIDRMKDMILTGGTNVYPREVEDAIADHPAVHLVSVIGVPDDKWGESVKAVIVLKEGCSATEEDILEHCRTKLAAYKKPKSVDFIGMSDMPMMGGGYKIRKRELRERYRTAYEKAKNAKIDSWGAAF